MELNEHMLRVLALILVIKMSNRFKREYLPGCSRQDAWDFDEAPYAHGLSEEKRKIIKVAMKVKIQVHQPQTIPNPLQT
eukprot:1611644-Amphidinium_carterae.1